MVHSGEWSSIKLLYDKRITTVEPRCDMPLRSEVEIWCQIAQILKLNVTFVRIDNLGTSRCDSSGNCSGNHTMKIFFAVWPSDEGREKFLLCPKR